MSGEQRPLVGRRTRPFVAVLLALAVAGLGHVYLRRWSRAAGWFAMILGTGLALIGLFAEPTAGIEQLPPTVLYPVVGLFLLSAVDAYLIARSGVARPSGSGGSGESDGPTCPHCGGELDADLSFCHWCTTPLDRGGDEESRV